MIRIRELKSADIPQIVEQQQRLIQYHQKFNRIFYAPSKTLASEFSSYIGQRQTDKDFKIYVAEESGRIIGFVMGWIRSRPPLYERRATGYMSNIFVMEADRGQGIGGRLYRRLEHWFETKDVDFVETSAYIGNTNTLEFFRSCSFRDLSIVFYKDLRRK